MNTIDNSPRFNNVLADEYDLLKMAIPHYDTVEGEVGKAVVSHFSGSSRHLIQVLEIGPGSGITTKVLLDCDPRTSLVAVDNEEKMLKQVRDRVTGWGADSRVSLVNREIGRYLASIPNCSFDVVASAFVLHNLEYRYREEIIRQIHRVLVPGGLFVNADKYALDDQRKRAEAYQEQIRRYDVYDSIGRPDYKAEWIEHYKTDEQPHIVFVEGLAKAHMREVGFLEVATVYRELMEAVVIGKKADKL